MKRKWFLLIFLSLLLLPSLTAQADDGVVPYSVEAVIPENQVDQGVTYFDIEMEQGERQELEVIVYNSSDEPITVEARANAAATNSNGLIIYDAAEEKPHESMLHPFNEITSIEQGEVEIGPNSQETVTVTVDAPNEPFDGTILGGLHFIQKQEASESEASLQIENRYAYALAVQIREAGNDTVVEPVLEFLSLEPGLINHRTGLQTQFANTAPKLIGGIEFEGSIYPEGSDEPIHTRTVEDFSIAPNSQFNFPVMFEDQKLEPGDYVFRAFVSNSEHEWTFEEVFEITAEAADKANDEAVEIEEEENTWMMPALIALGALVVVLLAVVIYLLLGRRK
ncbi:DUF916 and DUF3324 domain-containing protein [Salinicoccus sp. RF5]|uniref:DUF916 and DUF3324 domain-containing protein n=1 Tax=Salinicoccus sp. RF5 TaxID=2748874 RepID=UPI001E3D1E54|nr:DUF916 and DUF3324 domain-containing protein [Salinicoccus sp. RF5]MCC4722267.1 DUF916 and DUF3324 domain-containing protein [Salinicoccus sp. RF5]